MFGAAELGGPKAGKLVSFGLLLGLWVFYVILSALQSYEIIAGF